MVIFRIFDALRRPAWDRGTGAQIGDATRALGHGTSPTVRDAQYDFQAKILPLDADIAAVEEPLSCSKPASYI